MLSYLFFSQTIDSTLGFSIRKLSLHTSCQPGVCIDKRSKTLIYMNGKGFGKSPNPSTAKSNPPVQGFDEVFTATSKERPPKIEETPKLNMGQQSLERMRQERAEQKDAELRKVKQIRETDQLLQEDRGAAAIPEKVAMRMGKRMLPFVGIPLFGVMGAFVTFWYFAVYKNLQFETGLVAATTIAILVAGLLGITYSVMSASWDEDREGTLVGTDEFKRNLDTIKGGLSRSRENLLLREGMAGLSEEEVTAAIEDLDKRDATQNRRKQSFESRLDDDME